jgi:hypothetical protein
LFQAENRTATEVKPQQGLTELEADGGSLSVRGESTRASQQMRADMGALFPSLPQGSNGNPSLIMGAFQLVTMPMVGMGDLLQNLLPLLQNLPSPTQVFSG